MHRLNGRMVYLTQNYIARYAQRLNIPLYLNYGLNRLVRCDEEQHERECLSLQQPTKTEVRSRFALHLVIG